MIITIDTEHPPTPVELKHLWNLLTDVEPGNIPFEEDPRMTPVVGEEQKSDGEPGPKTKRRLKAAPATEQTVQQQAIALATRLVSEDKSDIVREALEAIKQPRVSLLTEEQAVAFLEAVGE